LHAELKETQKSIPERIAKVKILLDEQAATLEKQMKKESSDAVKRYAEAEIKQKEQTANLQKQLKDKDALVKKQQAIAESLEKELDSMTGALSSVQQESLFLANTLEEAQEKLNTIDVALSRDFAKKERSFKKQIKVLTKQLSDKESMLESQSAKIKVLSQETNELATDFFEVLDENVLLGDRVEKLKGELSIPHKKIEVLDTVASGSE